MVEKTDLVPLAPCLYEIPQGFRGGMRVPARLYADDVLLEAALQDRAIEQLVNTTMLPGVVRYTLAMPDMHQGYGFPIGGVAATALPDGIISPGGVGYDINCGVRLLSSRIEAERLRPHVTTLMNILFNTVPSGVGRGGKMHLSSKNMERVLETGSRWVVKQGYGTEDDLDHTEERGGMTGADAGEVSARAKKRGTGQLGSLGAGNHFLEVARVEEIYDHEAADRFGLVQGYVAVWIHCGSRGLGHQVCTDYVRRLQDAVHRYGIALPDRQLVCAPFESPDGQAYYSAMACAANYAWANRQMITHLVRRSFERALAGKVRDWELQLVYDVAHNIAKVERYELDGRRQRLCVHRKGATRSFGPGSVGVPRDYRDLGQPVLIPGDMGTASYVLLGTTRAQEDSFGSTCHGAGRVMSRSRAKKTIRGDRLRMQLEERGIVIRAASMPGLAEEAPQAYKDIHRVVEVVHRAGLARKVAKLEPMGVIKG